MTRQTRGRDRGRAGTRPTPAAEPGARLDDGGDTDGWPRERRAPASSPPLTSAAAGPVGAPGVAELAEALIQVTHALKYGGQQWREPCEPLARAVSMPQARLLAELWEARGTLRMSDVSAAMGVTPRNVTTIVDGLERRGLVRRRRDEHDRRAILLELTEQGRAHVARIHERQRALGERFFAPLDAQERRQLLRLLTKLRGACSWSASRA